MENLKNVAVSVLMLTHNRETMVGRAIDSILAQSFTDFELIIIDNGSADQSGKIAGEYAKRMSVSGYFAAMTAILAQGAIWR